ncbi:MAG: prenyltransferase [Candidatus Latescibacter sp.]|nr:prenyltransferase [Candidatus Latescibacter sp.]
MTSRNIQIWLRQTRANFLILSVLLVAIGGAAGWRDGSFHVVLFLLTVIGVVSAHTSVNLFNEYSDWRTGIDFHTLKTPFSGGSGTLQEELLKPRQVITAAWITLLFAFIIGLGLAWSAGWMILVFMAAGGLTMVFYSDYLARWMLGEIASGITLGSMVVAGAYYVQTGTLTPGIIWASIPPGILTALLLFLNEFPDAEADSAGGRRHLVIVLGKRRAAILYAASLLAMYVLLVAGVLAGKNPTGVLLGLLTLPLALITSYRALRYHSDTPSLIPAQGLNVIIVLGTDLLMAIGFIIG